MANIIIPVEKLLTHPISIWEPGWLVLTSGDFATGSFNCMTISWGSMGVMWGKPFVQVVVRPQRYTYQFIEKFPTFTVCAFPKRYRAALNILGTKSGRDGDKIAEAGLTLKSSQVVAAPCFTEAELIIECQKMYRDEFNPDRFLDSGIDLHYPLHDYHRFYYGQIMAVSGEDKYIQV